MKKLEAENKRKILVIVGPTASGKSALAVSLAKKLSAKGGSAFGRNGAEIISADSRQVYKGLNVGTGKITKAEMKGIPHHLLDVASPKKTFTALDYQRLGKKAIDKIFKNRKIPIICGGTGLYIRALIDGLVIPEVKPNLRLRKKLEKKSLEELFLMLKKKDPRRAKEIDPKNPRRLIRALEIVETLGTVPKLQFEPLKAETLMIGIKKEPRALNKLIYERLLKRLDGIIKEVKKLKRNGLQSKKLESFGLEYRYVNRFLERKISREKLIESLYKEICNYAKRQITWFKKNKRIHWIKTAKKAETLTKKFLKSVNAIQDK